MAGLRDVVFTGIFLFFLTQRISSNSSKSMSVWLFYLFHFHTFEDKINTCSRSGHRIITCCRYIQDNYRRLIYRVPSSAFSLRSFRCGVTAASGEESRKLLIWQHCAASPAESWEVISHSTSSINKRMSNISWSYLELLKYMLRNFHYPVISLNEFYISLICRHPLATLRKFRPLQSALMPTGTMEVFENSEAPV